MVFCKRRHFSISLGRVSCCGERGLLDIAFPPDYASKGYFYINYTNRDGNTVIARYFLTTDPTIADNTSEQILLEIDQPYANHNGGELEFGPNDGYLYIGVGDGGSGGDPDNRAQNPADLLGKLLRIDVESGVSPYAIPADNPFAKNPDYRPEIWALGLRNPWRFSFDALNGDLYISDVGELDYEEINYQPASSTGGENYGWRLMEGPACFEPADCTPTGLVLPVASYTHFEGNCSVTGGMVYRRNDFPRMEGRYFYADYCSGMIWGMRRNGNTWESNLLTQAPFTISSFGQDETGQFYLADYTNGSIYQISGN
ncbi:MAG: PQQ-dependent sugar dehydrogenase [Chloroflexaceae bacterium]|nr:PQQ-dependent sugar dehydrogenase [Chloroflexaceae bacterium]